MKITRTTSHWKMLEGFKLLTVRRPIKSGLGEFRVVLQKGLVNVELTKRAFFIRGLPFLMIACSFVHKGATFFL